MKKNNRDTEVIFTYQLPQPFYRNDTFAVTTGARDNLCTREFYEFDNVEEIEKLMLGLADMLNELRRLKSNGRMPR